MLGEGFHFFVIHAVDFVGSDFFGAIEASVCGHGWSFDKLIVLPVTARGGDFADVDFWVEVGGEGLAVIACIYVDDIDFGDFIEFVLELPFCKDVCDAGVEA